MVHRTPFFLPLFYPSLIWRMPATEKKLYLTFDDGPIAGPTEFVLETLSKANAKATFFCIGDNIRKHPTVFSDVVDKGHAVGNHTFHHVNGWRTGTQRYVDNIEQCSEAIQTHLPTSHPTPSLFRPPYGRITHEQIYQLQNFKIIMWDVLSIDYSRRLSPEKCLRKTIQATRNGSIIVFHDSLKAERNLSYALPRFIDHFTSQGFEFNVING